MGKYGVQFSQRAMEKSAEVVNPRIIQKLKAETPDPFLVTQYLKEIAGAYNVDWNAESSVTAARSLK